MPTEELAASEESREVTPRSNLSKPPLPPLAKAADLLTQKPPGPLLKRLNTKNKKSFVDDYWQAAKEQLFSDKKFLEVGADDGPCMSCRCALRVVSKHNAHRTD